MIRNFEMKLRIIISSKGRKLTLESPPNLKTREKLQKGMKRTISIKRGSQHNDFCKQLTIKPKITTLNSRVKYLHLI